MKDQVKQRILSLLRNKHAGHNAERLTQVESILSDELGAVHLELQDSPGHHVHGRTLYEKALRQARFIQIVFEIAGGSESDFDDAMGSAVHSPGHMTEQIEGDSGQSPSASSAAAPSIGQHEGFVDQRAVRDKPPAPTDSEGESSPAESPTVRTSPIYNKDSLIREFARRERDHGPNKAGFIVNDLLPRMGFDSSDAKRILRSMAAHDIVRTERRPNPKNPEHPTSFVTLNRAHPTVKRALGDEATTPFFEPVPIRGEPASATLIRERR